MTRRVKNRKLKLNRIVGLLVMALLATALPLLLAPEAEAAASFDCTVVIADDDVVVLFSGDDVGTTANLRNQTEWLATVTGQARFTVPDGAGDSYEVVLNDRVERVACVGGVPADYSCATVSQLGNELLTFWGNDVGASASLYSDNRFAGTVTGQDADFVRGGADADYSVWLRGSRQVVTCDDSAPTTYSCSALAQGNDTTLYFWGDDVPTTTAEAYRPLGRIGEVSGQDHLFVAGGASSRHHVRLADLRSAVYCDTAVTTAFSCTVFSQGGQATLGFEGSALGTAANVLRNGEWINNVTGQTQLVTTGNASDRFVVKLHTCLLYTSPSPRDATLSRMPSSA